MLSSSCWHTQKQSRALLFGDSNRLPVWCFGLGLEAVFCSTYVHYLKMGWTAQGCSRYTGACPYLSCVLDGSGASKNIESIWKQHWPSSFAFTDAKHSSMCQWVRSSHMFCKLSRAFFLLVLHAVDGCKWLGWLLQVCRDPICPNNSSPRRTVGMGSHFPPQPRRFHCHAGVGAAEQALPNGDC